MNSLFTTIRNYFHYSWNRPERLEICAEAEERISKSDRQAECKIYPPSKDVMIGAMNRVTREIN